MFCRSPFFLTVRRSTSELRGGTHAKVHRRFTRLNLKTLLIHFIQFSPNFNRRGEKALLLFSSPRFDVL